MSKSTQLHRTNYSSGTPWEPLVGFSRVVKVGNYLYLCGTTASNSKGEISGIGDPYLQTKKVIENIKSALESAGAKMSDVVRTRMFVTDLSKLEHYARAHREAFEKIRPASTIIQVERLIDPRLMVNMEVDAIIGAELVAEEKIAKY